MNKIVGIDYIEGQDSLTSNTLRLKALFIKAGYRSLGRNSDILFFSFDGKTVQFEIGKLSVKTKNRRLSDDELIALVKSRHGINLIADALDNKVFEVVGTSNDAASVALGIDEPATLSTSIANQTSEVGNNVGTIIGGIDGENINDGNSLATSEPVSKQMEVVTDNIGAVVDGSSILGNTSSKPSLKKGKSQEDSENPFYESNLNMFIELMQKSGFFVNAKINDNSGRRIIFRPDIGSNSYRTFPVSIEGGIFLKEGLTFEEMISYMDKTFPNNLIKFRIPKKEEEKTA